MKILSLAAGLMLSMSAFATEFHARIDNVDCKISDGVVTRTQTFGKEMKTSFTETRKVSMTGVEKFVQLVTETSSQLPEANDYGMRYSVTHEGKIYYPSTSDSKEIMFLIQMITKICR